jgi:hypothetical protein
LPEVRVGGDVHVLHQVFGVLVIESKAPGYPVDGGVGSSNEELKQLNFTFQDPPDDLFVGAGNEFRFQVHSFSLLMIEQLRAAKVTSMRQMTTDTDLSMKKWIL